jgi:isoleucyl-tRNA synthetase
MPYAQWHYPFENKAVFENQYPADFICEGIDQTRGWFYSLMAISTFLFDRTPYRHVVVNELVLDAEGNKMSKSRGNVVDPFEMLDRFGADVLRWYLLVNTPVWLPKRFDVEGLAEVKKKFFRPLIETYKFFALYANIDGFDPAGITVDFRGRPELDRWILSRLQSLIEEVREHLDRYDTSKAGRAIQEFVDLDLSNWYIRLSRRRFWKGERGADKHAAYLTLHEVLVAVSRLIAPFCPFLAERIYCNLTNRSGQPLDGSCSVHLATYPLEDSSTQDRALEEKMSVPRRVVQLGRSLREQRSLKVRQPLSQLIVATNRPSVRKHVQDFADIIRSELNVKAINFTEDAESLVHLRIKPNFKALGPKFGQHVKQIVGAVNGFGPMEIEAIHREGQIMIHVGGHEFEITRQDVEILHEEKEGLAVQSDGELTVAIDTHLTEELIEEGIAREFVNRIQHLRKEAGYEVIDRIRVRFEGPPVVREAIERQKQYVSSETLSHEILAEFEDGDRVGEYDLNGHRVRISVRKG